MTAEPPAFAVDADSIDPAVFGLTSYATSNVAPAPRIDRMTAMQVPAVKRSRDLIAGVLGSLPVKLYSPSKDELAWPLLEQPERHRPVSVTMTQLIEDMLFEERAWWQVLELHGPEAGVLAGFPSRVKRLPPREVSVNDETEEVTYRGRTMRDDELIRFDSPNDALLVVGARAIRTALMLEAATQRNADGIPPLDFFTPKDGDVDPGDKAEIKAMLAEFDELNRQRKTGYVPAALNYNVAGWDPEKLQLADQRQHATLEIGRHAGIDPEALGVAVTSRTYFNAEHKRREFVDFTLGGYLVALEGRLSMGDVSPFGHTAKVKLDAFLRSDTKTRMETYEIGERVGAYTKPEIRELEDKPPLAEQPAAPAPPVQLRAASTGDADTSIFDMGIQ